jgi:DNA invertase Pin-like site-specific DNA recombinase
MKRKEMTTPQLKKAHELFEAGIPFKEIVKEIGKSENTIWRNLKRIGAEKRRAPKQRDCSRAMSFIIQNLCTLRFASEKFGISDNSLRRNLKNKYGKEFHRNLMNKCRKKRIESITGDGYRPNGVDDSKIKSIINMTKNGYTYNYISEKLKVSRDTVKRVYQKKTMIK